MSRPRKPLAGPAGSVPCTAVGQAATAGRAVRPEPPGGRGASRGIASDRRRGLESASRATPRRRGLQRLEATSPGHSARERDLASHAACRRLDGPGAGRSVCRVRPRGEGVGIRVDSPGSGSPARGHMRRPTLVDTRTETNLSSGVAEPLSIQLWRSQGSPMPSERSMRPYRSWDSLRRPRCPACAGLGSGTIES
jgi:hypothetical protein